MFTKGCVLENVMVIMIFVPKTANISSWDMLKTWVFPNVWHDFHGCDGCDLGILGLYPLIFGRNQIAFWLASGVCWMSFSPEECDEVRRKYGWLGLSSTLSRGFHDGILVWSQCDHHRPIESHWGMVFCLFPNMFPTSHVSMFGESGWQMDDIKNGVQAPGCWAGIQHDFNAELLGGPFLNSSTCQWVVDIYGTDHWLFNIAMV